MNTYFIYTFLNQELVNSLNAEDFPIPETVFSVSKIVTNCFHGSRLVHFSFIWCIVSQNLNKPFGMNEHMYHIL